MASTNSHPQANLARLPAELHHLIFAQLSRKDHKALRQTCHSLTNITTGYVFFRAHISLLREDRDAFLNISNSPHLRDVVEQVVWYDIPPMPNVSNLEKIYNSEPRLRSRSYYQWADPPGIYGQSNKDLMQVLPYLVNLYYRARWWNEYTCSFMSRREVENERRGSPLGYFVTRFITALEQMPRLRTMISRPIPYDKVICSGNSSDIPFVIGCFKRFPDYSPDSEPPDSSRLGTTYSGLDSSILVILEAISRSSKLSIESLYFADRHTRSRLININGSHAEAFRQLKHIDLCICGLEHALNLTTCLHAAGNLHTLKLCYENALTERDDGLEAWKYTIFWDIFSEQRWEHLSSIEFVDSAFQLPHLESFITNHQSSLRHIRLQDCSLYNSCVSQLVAHMTSLPNLILDTIYISLQSSDAIFKPDWLRGIVNAKKLPVPPVSILQSSDVRFWNEEAWPEIVVHDIRQRPEIFAEHGIYIDGDDGTDVDDDNPVTQHPPTYWVLDQVGPDIIFYSKPTLDDGVGYNTQVWKFIYRDGSVAWTDRYYEVQDPFEFFEDWDSEEGDRVEPTPYGPKFDAFKKENQLYSWKLEDIDYPSNARVFIAGYQDEPLTRDKLKKLRKGWVMGYSEENLESEQVLEGQDTNPWGWEGEWQRLARERDASSATK